LTTYLDATVSYSITGGLSGTDIGGKMKETGITHWASPNTGANNSSGFTALPGGHRSIDYSYSSITTNGYFWSSTPFSSNAWFWRLDNSNSNIFRSNNSLQNGFSVRCLKD
jgi:uncharacterized protein (TIGR02145 family)